MKHKRLNDAKKIIEKEKNKLIKKVRKNGIYENFGQKELDNIKEKYPVYSFIDDDDKLIQNLINNFRDWCETYNG